jgi:hypothetical protein
MKVTLTGKLDQKLRHDRKKTTKESTLQVARASKYSQ